MNTLLSVRCNIIYSKKGKAEKKDPDEFNKYHELIFLVDKPSYLQTNSGEIINERAIDELRFTVSEKAYDELIKVLVKIQNADESELS